MGFTRGWIGLYQVVAERLDPAREVAVPTTREAVYAPPTPARSRARAS